MHGLLKLDFKGKLTIESQGVEFIILDDNFFNFIENVIPFNDELVGEVLGGYKYFKFEHPSTIVYVYEEEGSITSIQYGGISELMYFDAKSGGWVSEYYSTEIPFRPKNISLDFHEGGVRVEGVIWARHSIINRYVTDGFVYFGEIDAHGRYVPSIQVVESPCDNIYRSVFLGYPRLIYECRFGEHAKIFAMDLDRLRPNIENLQLDSYTGGRSSAFGEFAFLEAMAEKGQNKIYIGSGSYELILYRGKDALRMNFGMFSDMKSLLESRAWRTIPQTELTVVEYTDGSTGQFFLPREYASGSSLAK